MWTCQFLNPYARCSQCPERTADRLRARGRFSRRVQTVPSSLRHTMDRISPPTHPSRVHWEPWVAATTALFVWRDGGRRCVGRPWSRCISVYYDLSSSSPSDLRALVCVLVVVRPGARFSSSVVSAGPGSLLYYILNRT